MLSSGNRLLWHNKVIVLWRCFTLGNLKTRIILGWLLGRERGLWLLVQILIINAILVLVMMLVTVVSLLKVFFIMFEMMSWVLFTPMELRLPDILG